MIEQLNYSDAKAIMGGNCIGSDELKTIDEMQLCLPQQLPVIPFSEEELEGKKENYLLILGTQRFADGNLVTIRNMRELFGNNPEIHEPCFYNQDWYDHEQFIDVPLKDEWFLIRKSVYEESRARQPQELVTEYCFPSAIRCTYSFFVTWFVLKTRLWEHDFVWCEDTDHNGDRIYIGKYHDIDGVNKNGFSIHRHLALRPCYGCID